MPHYLLDTSIYSQPLRRRPVMKALERWQAVGDGSCRVSVVTVAEVEFGLCLEGNSERWERYRLILQGRLPALETDASVWSEFSRRKARQHELGQIVSDLDLLIAATAMMHQLTVATLDSQDFSRMEGISWEDWSK